ncbi:uncharacterized protein METZ01_LOCUS117390, partial [marine metagenome]
VINLLQKFDQLLLFLCPLLLTIYLLQYMLLQVLNRQTD